MSAVSSKPFTSVRYAVIDLVPVELIGYSRRLAATELPGLAIFTSPLQREVALFYSFAGCWNLALALHEATGLPIEIYLRDGLPRHAYVVSGDSALDAWGRRELRHARAGSDEIKRVSAAGLIKELHRRRVREMFQGTSLDVAVVGRREWRKKAARTAALLLETSPAGGKAQISEAGKSG
jgi:hypothetical protein